MDLKLELVLVPVTDVDRAKAFYTDKAGFNMDVDTSPMENFRVVQLTPPGSACSIGIGLGITDAAPGSTRGLHLVVSDIEAARQQLVERGMEVSDIRHVESGEWHALGEGHGASGYEYERAHGVKHSGRVTGADPEHADYNSFADFKDPDGNVWVLQEKGHQSAA